MLQVLGMATRKEEKDKTKKCHSRDRAPPEGRGLFDPGRFGIVKNAESFIQPEEEKKTRGRVIWVLQLDYGAMG